MERRNYQLQWSSKDLGNETIIDIGNIKGDGSPIIAAGATSERSSKGSNLYLFQHFGNSYHQISDTPIADKGIYCIKVFDIDRDGADEIIVGCGRNIYIYKYQANRLVRICESDIFPGNVISIAIGDIDRDGKLEIVISIKGSKKIFIYRYDGKLIFVKESVFDYTVCSVAIGDTDGDGRLEVVVKTRNIIYVMEFTDGKHRKKWHTHITGSKDRFLIVKDFNKDGICEIICESRGRKIIVIGHRHGNYRTIWESEYLDEDCEDGAVYDIDGDSRNELVIICLSTCYIFGWKGEGIILEWTQTIPNGAICIVAGEFGKKGLGEIIIGTIYGYIYVVEARHNRHIDHMWVGKVQSIIQDTVEIPANKPDAERAVEANVRFSVDEVTVIKDKVIVAGDVAAKILYVANLPSQPVHFFQANFPFLTFIHLHGAKPGMGATAFFNVEHIKVMSAGPRTIKITILFEMSVKLIPCYHHTPPCYPPHHHAPPSHPPHHGPHYPPHHGHYY